MSGIDFSNYKHATIQRRIQRRLFLRQLANLREYVEFVNQNPAEAVALAEDVLIHVTSFFRDPDVFAELTASVFPKLLEDRPREAPLRIWIPGCSTGEEVYSIAISLVEVFGDAAVDFPIQIFATDVSSVAIAKARAATYAESIERDVSQVRLQRFFTKTGSVYQIRKEIRDLCIFAIQDVTRDPPFSAIDLISCRNLMIYLGSSLQDRIISVLHYALKERGFLILGTSETARSFPGFAVVDAKHKIYARTAAAARPPLDFASPLPETRREHELTIARPMGALDVQREADRLVLAEFGPPGVVVTDDLVIVQFRGHTGRYLDPAPGAPRFELLRMVREELRLPVTKTIDAARTKRHAVRKAVLLSSDSSSRTVEVEVMPFASRAGSETFFVVLFNEPTSQEQMATPEEPSTERTNGSLGVEDQLRDELATARDHLQSVIEQHEADNEELRAMHEEVISTNEELRSTNEELQTAKEELQATNEELRTVNDELSQRNVEGKRLNEDLTNVLTSAEIPIVILGGDLRIRRFTAAAAQIFRLIPTDVGRLITDIKPILQVDDFDNMIAEVREHLRPVERTVPDEQGRFYQLTIRPYMTLDARVDGTVVTAFDIDRVKKGERLLAEARRYAESIVDTVRESLIALDRDLRIRSANRAFFQTFQESAETTIGRHLHELDHGAWNIPALTKLLGALQEGEKFDGFRVERDFTGSGRRVFMLNARRIESTAWVLLAIEDVTDRTLAEEALTKSERDFREMLTRTAGEAIVVDAAGRIVSANPMAMQMFGFEPEEMVGMMVDALVPERLRDRHAKHREDFLAGSLPMGHASDLVGRRKDGTEFPIEVNFGSMQRGTDRLVVSFITDTTRQRESEGRIIAYQEKLQRMAFDAAVAEERERRRIAADLHDRIGQSLALAQIKLTSVRETMAGPSRKAIDEAVDLLEQSVVDTRTLTFELSPPVLYDLGIKEALSWLIEEIEKREGIRIELVDDNSNKPLDEATAALVYRAVRELLLNVLKHAQAPKAKVTLRRVDDHYAIDVEDSGIGFDPADAASKKEGFGLFSIREQIRRLGGTVEIASAPRQGTRVSVRVPVTTEEPPKSERAP